MSEEHFLFLLQLLVVLALARVLGEWARRLGQPPLAGEILAGILLGKTVLGRLAPEFFAALFPENEIQIAMLEVVAQIGVLFLLLAVGLEVDVASAWKLRRQSLAVAVAGVVVPLLLGVAAAWVGFETWREGPVERLAFSLFVGVAVAITAITVVARLLFDLQLVKSDLGLLLLSAMAINDLLGWLVLAVVMGIVGAAPGGTSVAGIGGVLLGAVVFAVFGATVGRALVTRLLRRFDRMGLPTPATPLSFAVCLALLCGVLAHLLGLHPIFGFLIGGVMAGDHRALSERTRSIITQIVEAVFVPLFFASICLRVDFAARFDPGLVFAVTLISIFGKFGGAWLGAAFVRLPSFDRLPIGLAHIPGGSVGVVLAAVGVEIGIIGPAMFVALVFASIASSLLVGPALAWSLKRREALNVIGFLSRGGVLRELAAHDRDAAIDELVRCAGDVERSLDVGPVREAVHAREETVGTGIGSGIAVPHARLDGLERPLVVFGRSREGIDWDAVDDQPAHLLFLILTPEGDNESQLEILATIASGLAQEEAREALLHSETPDALWSSLQRLLQKPSGVRA